MTIERLISLIFAAGVLVYACWLEPTTLPLFAAMQMALPLAAIWYRDELSDLLGHGRFRARTPGVLVRICGWILLLLSPFGVYAFKLRLELSSF